MENPLHCGWSMEGRCRKPVECAQAKDSRGGQVTKISTREILVCFYKIPSFVADLTNAAVTGWRDKSSVL
jgi:hypothetical protein